MGGTVPHQPCSAAFPQWPVSPGAQVLPGGPSLPFWLSGQGSCSHKSLMPPQLGWFPSPLKMLFSLTNLINTPHPMSEPSASCLTLRDVSLWSGKHGAHIRGVPAAPAQSASPQLPAEPVPGHLAELRDVAVPGAQWGWAGQSGSRSSGLMLAFLCWPLSLAPLAGPSCLLPPTPPHPGFLFCPRPHPVLCL